MIYALTFLILFTVIIAWLWVGVNRQLDRANLDAEANPKLRKAIRKQYDDSKRDDEAELDAADLAGTIGFLNRLRDDKTSIN